MEKTKGVLLRIFKGISNQQENPEIKAHNHHSFATFLLKPYAEAVRVNDNHHPQLEISVAGTTGVPQIFTLLFFYSNRICF